MCCVVMSQVDESVIPATNNACFAGANTLAVEAECVASVDVVAA